ncbi:MAG: helix-turn-helix transcriptional regulator, partial [Chloroflexota bacterium]
MTESDITRAKILGLLVRDARQHAGRSIEDCAKQLGIEPSVYDRIEWGEAEVSLPILETLALYFDIPISHFLGDQLLAHYPPDSYINFLVTRTREIAMHIRAIREAREMTQENLAEETGIEFDTIAEYESGAIAVPILHLDRISKALDHALVDFLDNGDGSYMVSHETRHRRLSGFQDLPDDLQA